MLEVETKYRVLNIRKFRRTLHTLGLRSAGSKTQVDTYYTWVGAKRLGRPHLLRLRQEIFSNHKISVLEYSRSLSREAAYEYEVKIGDAHKLHQLLLLIGFTCAVTVRKKRTEWQRRGVEIELDSVKGIGTFVELEVMGVRKGKALKQIQALALRLGLDESARSENLKYYELALRKKKR